MDCTWSKSMRITYEVDRGLEEELGRMSKRLAKYVVGVVEKEFVELLNNAPQRSGNYVANFAVSGGSRIGRQQAVDYFPPEPTNQEIVGRGSTPAITMAMLNNSNLKDRLTSHITRGSGGWLPTLTVYNRIDYAGDVEGYGVSSLRDVNKPGVHAMSKFTAKLKSALSANVLYGSTRFNTVADIKYL